MKEYKPILHESEGYGFQRLTVKITDPEAIQKIMDGRYETVSVRMSTDHCFCSICDVDWSAGEPCEHTPGQKYDGKLAYMTTGDLSYRELSFVNIPADEYAGVKEAIISENKDALEVGLYANSDSDKVLSDLSTGNNLYAFLDSEEEDSDKLVAYLLDKSTKDKKIDKEEDVKLTDLTKDQLKDLEAVKELVKEAEDKALEAAKKVCEDAAKDCEAKLKKMEEDCKNSAEDAAKKAEEVKEESDAKKKEEPKKEEEKKEEPKEEEKEESEEEKKKKVEEEEEEEDKKKKAKKGAPVPNELPENKGKGKEGGVKHGAGNLSPVGEDPGDAAVLANKVKELEDSNKKILDENVKINSELHKMVAERLYDLKKTLRKPDVANVLTPDARDKKVEEFAQRSVDSLKDQIRDLLLEQDNALTAGLNGNDVENPAISQPDLADEALEGKRKIKEGKQETLTRLFPKSK